jgi:membrane protease YdiL (CAAX protease family)
LRALKYHGIADQYIEDGPLSRQGGYNGTIALLRRAPEITALTIGVLLFYQSWMQPDVTALGAAIPVAAFGNLILAGICFSIGNTVLEELAFRGVLFDAQKTALKNRLPLPR